MHHVLQQHAAFCTVLIIVYTSIRECFVVSSIASHRSVRECSSVWSQLNSIVWALVQIGLQKTCESAIGSLTISCRSSGTRALLVFFCSGTVGREPQKLQRLCFVGFCVCVNSEKSIF